MGKFKIVQTMKLDFVGEEWKECYMKLEPLSTRESEEIDTMIKKGAKESEVKEILELVKSKFIEGTGIDAEGKKIMLTKEDLLELPMFVLLEMVRFLSGIQAVNK